MQSFWRLPSQLPEVWDEAQNPEQVSFRILFSVQPLKAAAAELSRAHPASARRVWGELPGQSAQDLPGVAAWLRSVLACSSGLPAFDRVWVGLACSFGLPVFVQVGVGLAALAAAASLVPPWHLSLWLQPGAGVLVRFFPFLVWPLV